MAKRDKRQKDSDALIKALGHPTRQDLMRAVLETDEAISPRELASRIFQPLSNVSYHVRVLLACNALKLVRTKPVRGSMQHFYRANDAFRDSPLVAIVLELESSPGSA